MEKRKRGEKKNVEINEELFFLINETQSFLFALIYIEKNHQSLLLCGWEVRKSTWML